MSDVETWRCTPLRIVILEGTSAGRTFLVEQLPVVLGRGTGVQIQLEDNVLRPTLSRRHLEVDVRDDRLILTDLSTNGTRVGTRQLTMGESTAVADGEEVWLGTGTRISIHRVRPAGTGQIVVRALGRAEIVIDGQVVLPAAFKTRKAFLVCMMLVDYGPGGVALQTLCDTFWPDASHATQSLYTAVSRVRRALRREMVQQGNGVYRFGVDQDVRYDVAEFETACKTAATPDPDSRRACLRSALNFTGTFLEGWEDEWVAARRTLLIGRYLSAAETLGSLYEGSCEWELAATLYRGVLDRHPLFEPGHVGLMRCLQAQGRRSEAMQQFHLCEALLQKQLGVSPSPQTVDVYRQMI